MAIERWEPFRGAMSLRDAMDWMFRESFIQGGALDISGWWVTFARAADEPKGPLALGDVTVSPLGGGVLEVPELTL